MFKFFLTLSLFCFLVPHPIWAKSNSLIERMQGVLPSLVEIKTVYTRALKTKSGRSGLASYERHGAGIILDASGIIVTNTHTIINAPHIYVGLSDGTVREASVLLITEADFSFIKIDPPYPLTPIRWADSSQAQLGQPIIALGGNSDMNNQSILGGHITSLLESMSAHTIEMLEINLNLYEGDSGGPILDEQGRLLGLIMAKRKTQDRQSYAIASNKIRQEYLLYKQKMK